MKVLPDEKVQRNVGIPSEYRILAMKKTREHCDETWIIFLDLVKAFDRVPCNLLWIILERFGFPPKIITILKSLHKNVNVKFTAGTVTRILSSIIGVKQGDILGPMLFTTFIAAIMITWRKIYDRSLCIFRTKKDFILTGRRSTTKGIDFLLIDSEYADNTAVLFDSRESLETFSPLSINHFEKFGMEVHVGHCDQPNKSSKTDVLFVSAPPSSYAEPTIFDDINLQPINLGNNRFLPIVTKFNYLGTTLNIDCRDNEVVVFKIKKAGNAFGALRKCFYFLKPNISVDAERARYEGLILSILLYSAECYNFKISNKELLRRLNLRKIDDYIIKRQLRWGGHVARMDFDRLPEKCLCGYVLNVPLVHLNFHTAVVCISC